MSRRRVGRCIAFHPVYVEWTGSIPAALLLSQLVYWEERCNDPEGWVYKTSKEWQEETTLTEDQQIVARKKLRESGLVEEKKSGNRPPRIYYRIVDKEYRRRAKRWLVDGPENPQIEKLTARKTPKSQPGKAPSQSHHHDDESAYTTNRDRDARASRPSLGLSLNGEHSTPGSKFVSQFSEFTVRHRYHVGKTGSTLTGWSSTTLSKWRSAIEVLLETIDPKRIERVLDWYLVHHKDPWVRSCYTLITFCHSFLDLEKAMKRDMGVNGDEESGPRVQEEDEGTMTQEEMDRETW